MEQCALSYDDELELMQYVESKGLIFISTPFSGLQQIDLENLIYQLIK